MKEADAQDFVFKNDFGQVCSTLMFDARFFAESDTIIKLIFDEMTIEAVENYV